MASRKLEAHQVRKICALADCDERTLRKFETGSPIRGGVRDRIADALHSLNYDSLVSSTTIPQSRAISSTPKTRT
jgi:hypothetical protein